jgi:DNA-binding NarL/FixJ family response regulator
VEQAIRIRVLYVDDHALVRKGLAAILGAEPGVELVGEASSAADAVLKYRELQPDVMLMDLRLPDRSGTEATIEIRREFPKARIIALTSFGGDQDIYRAFDAGVRGYLLKEMVHTEVIRAIQTVHSGKRYIPPEVSNQLTDFFPEYALTPRESEVLRLVALGYANKEVGAQLGTAPGTVKSHVQSILAKLSAKDRTHAVTIAVQRGILHVDPNAVTQPGTPVV